MHPSGWKVATVAALGLALVLGFRPLWTAHGQVPVNVEKGPAEPTVTSEVTAGSAPERRSSDLAERLRLTRETREACEALEALGGLGDSVAVDAILTALHTRAHSAVRDCAVTALGRVEGDRATNLLVGMIDDRETGARNVAIQALAKRADLVSRSTVIQVVEHGEPSARYAALEALAAVHVPGAALLLEKDLATTSDGSALQREILAALGFSGDASVVPTLAGYAMAPSTTTRRAALGAAVSLGGSALWIVKAALARGEEDAELAIDELRAVDAEDARALLIEATGDRRPRVATHALEALAYFVGEDVRAAVAAHVESPHLDEATAAARWLAMRGDPTAVATLADVARGSDASSMDDAIGALADLDTEEARVAIADIASRPGPGRGRALRELASSASGAAQARIIATRMVRNEGGNVAAEALTALTLDDSPEASRALAEVARGGGKLGASAVEGLSSRHDDVAVAALVDIAHSAGTDDGATRNVAIEALGGSHDARALRALVDAAGDPDCRAAALASLARSGGPEAERALTTAASSEDPARRADAARALVGEVPPSMLPRLAGLARDPNPEVSEAGFAALRQTSPEGALAVLKDSLGASDPAQRVAAVSRATDMDTEVTRPLLIEALHDKDSSVIAAAAAALSQAGGSDAQQALLEVLTSTVADDDARRAAADSLREMGGAAARDQAPLLDRWAEPRSAASDREGRESSQGE